MKLLLRLVALAFLACTSIQNACADVYRYVTKDDDGDAIFLNESTVVKSGSTVSYWLLNVESAYLKRQIGTTAYYLMRQTMNCDLQTMRSTDMSVYDATGRRLTADSEGSEESSIEPGTIEQSFFNIVCEGTAATEVARSVAISPLAAAREFRDALTVGRKKRVRR